MRRWGAFIAVSIAGTALAAGAIYWNHSQKPDLPTVSSRDIKLEPDPEIQRLIERLKAFDPTAYARAAIAKRNFRHVVALGESNHEQTPGIRCVAGRDKARYLGFVHGRLSESPQLDEAIVAAARQFNRALTSDPAYPDKDVCFPAPKILTRPETNRIAAEATRRPQIVDLHTAVRAQDLAAVTRYVAAGSGVNAVDSWSRTPLMWAAHRRNVAIATKLLTLGGKLDTPDGLLKGALQIATETGDADFLRQLLSAARRHGIRPRNRGDALNAAVTQERTDLIELLLEYGEAPRPGDSAGWEWPLRTALSRECTACMETLLAKGRPNTARTSTIQVLIAQELDRSPSKTLLPLIRAALDGLSHSRAAKQVLVIALKKNDLALVRKLLADTHDVNLLRTHELADLLSATDRGDERQRDAILAAAKARRRDLDAAIRANDQERIRKFAADGATLDQDLVFTPLMQAAVASNSTTIETLLELGSKVDARVGPLHSKFTTVVDEAYIDEGTTALYCAIKHLNVDAARALLRHGANLDAKDGAWPMLTSVGRLWENAPLPQQERLVDLLLSQGQRQKYADQMLASAASWGRKGLIDILIARGASSCSSIDYHRQAVESVASLGDLSLLKHLISLCPDWSPTAPVAQATLKEALSPIAIVKTEAAARLEVVRYLLAQRIPLPQPEYGATALGRAVGERNTKLVELLLAYGADINELCEGRTALDQVYNNEEMTTLLRARGARTAKELGVNTEYPFPF